jgi:hypothetical protein
MSGWAGIAAYYDNLLPGTDKLSATVFASSTGLVQQGMLAKD